MKAFWILFAVAALILLSLLADIGMRVYEDTHTQPASYCTPAPGQCAFDGYGVYCLLPPDRAPLRNGEPK